MTRTRIRRAATDVHPKVAAAGIAGTVVAVVMWALNHWAFKGGIPDDVTTLVYTWVPVICGTVAGYLTPGDTSSTAAPPAV